MNKRKVISYFSIFNRFKTLKVQEYHVTEIISITKYKNKIYDFNLK